MNGSTPTIHIDHPQSDELEVTIFGSGYGESLVVHIGNGNWIIVDSLINRDKKKPAALEYLENIGVDPSTQVKGVIVTHWHDDHIKGISEIAERCSSAKFFISAAFTSAQNRKKFLKLVLDSSISRLAHLNADSVSGVREFGNLLRTLKEKKVTPGRALQDRMLLEQEGDVELWALSPHDSILEKAIEAIITQLPDKTGSIQRVSAPKPNYTSVVLWLKFGDVRALFGADLEENSEHKGWSLIVAEKKKGIVDQKAELFKVAHHGSITGHHDDIWNELLTENPICLVAPFSKNPKLPMARDVARIKSLSDRAYITSFTSQEAANKISKDKHVKRKLIERQVTFADEPYSYVRVRKKQGEDWAIQTYGNACQLSSLKNTA